MMTWSVCSCMEKKKNVILFKEYLTTSGHESNSNTKFQNGLHLGDKGIVQYMYSSRK